MTRSFSFLPKSPTVNYNFVWRSLKIKAIASKLHNISKMKTHQTASTTKSHHFLKTENTTCLASHHIHFYDSFHLTRRKNASSFMISVGLGSLASELKHCEQCGVAQTETQLLETCDTVAPTIIPHKTKFVSFSKRYFAIYCYGNASRTAPGLYLCQK